MEEEGECYLLIQLNLTSKKVGRKLGCSEQVDTNRHTL